MLRKLQRPLSSTEFCLFAVLANTLLTPQCKPRSPPCASLSLLNTRLCPETPASPALHCLGLQDCQLSESHLRANLYSAANKLRPKALRKISYRHLQLGRSQGFTIHTAILI